MSDQDKAAKPRTPIPYSQREDRASKEPDKVSDAFAEYVTSATAGARQSPKTKRWIDRPPVVESTKANLPRSQSIAGIPMPGEVWRFAMRHELLPHLEKAIQFVYECFPSVKGIALSHEVDLETPSESWISIDIQIHGEVDELLENYLHFIRRKVQEIPPDKTGKILLGFGGE